MIVGCCVIVHFTNPQKALTSDHATAVMLKNNTANMRIVSLLAPIRCGVYQVHCNLSRDLSQRGCTVTWLCSGSAHAGLIASENAEPTDGEIVASHTDNMIRQNESPSQACKRDWSGRSRFVMLWETGSTSMRSDTCLIPSPEYWSFIALR